MKKRLILTLIVLLLLTTLLFASSCSESTCPPHTYGDWVITSAASCTTVGSRQRICTQCGDIQTEEIPVLGHSWGVGASCTTAQVCTVCNIENPDAPALGHNWAEDFTIDTPATCTTAGSKSIHCLNGCGEKSQVTAIPTLGHIDDNTDRICDRCNGTVLYYEVYDENDGITRSETANVYNFTVYQTSATFYIQLDAVYSQQYYGQVITTLADITGLNMAVVDADITEIEYSFSNNTITVTVNYPTAQLDDTVAVTFNIYGDNIRVNIDIVDEFTLADFTWRRGTTPLSSEVYLDLNVANNLVLTTAIPSNYEITYTYSSTNASIVSVQTLGSTVKLTKITTGTVIISCDITITNRDDLTDVTQLNGKTITLHIVEVPDSLTLIENQVTYGIADEYVVGDKVFDNSLEYGNYSYRITPVCELPDGDSYVFTSSNESVATINSQGIITILADGYVTITVESLNSSRVGSGIKDSFTFHCVQNTVMVSTYDQLVKASYNGTYAIALLNSIGSDTDMLSSSKTQPFYSTTCPVISGVNWYAFDESDTTKKVAYSTRTATSDLQFNENKIDDYTCACGQKLAVCGHDRSQAGVRNTINVGLVFTKDVYGNGFTLNAHNLTMPVFGDYSGGIKLGVFNGAVNFVSFNAGNLANPGTNSYTVYGQDNIAFLIEGSNVDVDNITLQSCDATNNLTTLDYVGTTVEVIGENHTISHSTMWWGRTVLRVFSGNAMDYTDTSKTSVTLNNCILAHSREFTLRMGSNTVLKDNAGVNNETNTGLLLAKEGYNSIYANASAYADAVSANRVYLNPTATNNVEAQEDALLADEYFMNTYIRTRVTLNNVVFMNSGLFAIGMDSHFAGAYLNDRPTFGWANCAGTSYGALLTLQGQVRFYEWKDFTKINSASLVGLSSTTFPDPFGLTNMIDKENTDRNLNLLDNVNSVQYVNGAIAFFGGGRNYNLIDNQCTNDTYKLDTTVPSVCIGLGDVEIEGGIGELTSRLVSCAGNQDFRFYMFDCLDDFDKNKQDQDIANNLTTAWLSAN
ncbi:MAG: hypothetical protein PHW00_00330 [Clostridia bacterium]|nr:hypothetical protein [Clostridia bacterium]